MGKKNNKTQEKQKVLHKNENKSIFLSKIYIKKKKKKFLTSTEKYNERL